MRIWACTCGAKLKVPDTCPEGTWKELVRTMESEHTGHGHGRCEVPQALKARRKTERKPNAQRD